jgi:hypothetical protein
MGVTVVVAGGMGGGAVTIFQERGVEVVSGASGDARQSVEKYLKGELKSTGAVCHEHKMEHEGIAGSSAKTRRAPVRMRTGALLHPGRVTRPSRPRCPRWSGGWTGTG